MLIINKTLNFQSLIYYERVRGMLARRFTPLWRIFGFSNTSPQIEKPHGFSLPCSIPF